MTVNTLRIVEQAYVEATRSAERERRSATVALVAAKFQDRDARDMSRRDYNVMKSGFLSALVGGSGGIRRPKTGGRV